MKALLIAAAVALLGSTGAQAADMAAKVYTKAPAAVPYTNWAGFYAGASGGYGGADRVSDIFANDVASLALISPAGGANSTALGPSSFNTSGGFGGLQAGYNWQLSRFVLGVEADINFADIKANASISNLIANNPAAAATLNSSEALKWFGTARGRLGYLATNHLLLFATGGFAYGRVDQAATYTSISNVTVLTPFGLACTPNVACYAGNSSKTEVGYTVGAGGEWMIWKNVSLKAEYSYINLGNSSYNIRATAPTVPTAVSSMAIATTLDYHLGKVGLNWHF